MGCFYIAFLVLTATASALTDGNTYTISGTHDLSDPTNNGSSTYDLPLDSEDSSGLDPTCDKNLTGFKMAVSATTLYSFSFDHDCPKDLVKTVNLSGSFIVNASSPPYCEFEPNMVCMDLSCNNISVLGGNSFQSCSAIKRLSLRDNMIHLIHKDAFLGIETLEFLDISINNLSGIVSGVFDSFINLKYLNLSRNDIVYITNGAFLRTTKLEMIDLSHNRIHSLPTAVFYGMNDVKYLYLQKNKIVSNSFDFLDVFSDLTLLDLSENNFSTIPTRAFDSYNISRLVLSNMPRLEWVSEQAFTSSPHLIHISLRGNPNLMIHEQAFSGLDQLHSVDLTNSQVLVLPEINVNTTLYLSNSSVFCQCYQNALNRSRHHHTYTEDICNLPNGSHVSGPDMDQSGSSCGPFIMSTPRDKYSLRVSEKCMINCKAIGKPWPSVTLEHCPGMKNGSDVTCYTVQRNMSVYELKIAALNQEGVYRCTAVGNNKTIHRYFSVVIKRTKVVLKLLSRGEDWIIITWGQSKCPKAPVILSRSFELTSKYDVTLVHAHWKLYKLDDLKPSTGYEICMASGSDILDRKCIRVWTKKKENRIPGIHKDSVVISVLVVCGLVFSAFVVTTCLRCASKLRNISKRYVYIVNSESRDSFRDVTCGDQQMYTNPCADFVVESSFDS